MCGCPGSPWRKKPTACLRRQAQERCRGYPLGHEFGVHLDSVLTQAGSNPTTQQIDPKVYGSEDIDRQNDNAIKQDLQKQPTQEDIQAVEKILEPKDEKQPEP
jgi:hypothetical protein